MRSVEHLSSQERRLLEELRAGIQQQFPDYSFRMTVFGSRARGEAEPDSDMDVLVDLDVPRFSFLEKQRLRRVAGEVSLKSGIILSLLVVDRRTQEERGDYSIFQNIREEGIPV